MGSRVLSRFNEEPALDTALAQLPDTERAHLLVRTDTGGGVKAFLHHITDLGLEYSVGFYGVPGIVEALQRVPRQVWRTAIDTDGNPRDGAQVAELTGYLPATLVGWPNGMRGIARRERPHPGAQLRLTDHEGWRITCFATNTKCWRPADLTHHPQRSTKTPPAAPRLALERPHRHRMGSPPTRLNQRP